MANITSWENVGNITSVLQMPNTSTSGWFWAGMAYMITIVLVMAMINFGIEIAMLVGLFIGILVMIPLVYMGLAPMSALGILVGGIILLIIYLMWSSNKNV